MGPKKRSVLAASPPSSSNPNSNVNQTGQPYQTRSRGFVETGRWAAKGTKPVPEPATISGTFSDMFLLGCKKYLFLEPKYRLIFYSFFLFFISLMADYVSFPKSYFSKSSNVLNQYFVKLSWGWTLTLVGAYIFFTSAVYCCGNIKSMSRQFSRLLIGTGVWFVTINLFLTLEEFTGYCVIKEGMELYSIKNRKICSTRNGKWTSFDISGHCFLLIFCVLLICEETKTILNWDSIKDLIRNENYHRAQVPQSISFVESETQLSHLTLEDYEKLKTSYNKYGGLAKIQFFILTLLTLLWDFMIMMTCTYFHIMIEKVLGGIVAITWWYFLYHGLYTWKVGFSPGLPGGGYFRYSNSQGTSGPKLYSPSAGGGVGDSRNTNNSPSSSNNGGSNETLLPKFMGMPLYGLKNKVKEPAANE